MNTQFVSVIIPTYNDWSRLKLCIDALLNQTFPKNQFEVIIINNNPQDNKPDDFLIPENYQLLTENKPGSYAARNAGLQVAKGNIIAFTDSDCIPDPNWILNAINHFKQFENCERIAGHINIFPKGKKATVAEKYDIINSLKQKFYVSNFGTCVTANAFAYKHVFDRVGLFNDNKMSSGDLDWGTAAEKLGYRIHYVENVIINHPARDLKELIKKEKRIVGGKNDLYAVKEKWYIAFLKFLQDARPLLGEYASIKRKSNNTKNPDLLLLLLLRYRLRYIRALEILKLKFGKTPNRE